MSPRRTGASIAANPVLIGAATTLVVIVAVFLAYNANSGLPFVPVYELKSNVPSAANLVKGNDVRIGGSRVGVVSEIRPRRNADGRYSAELTLRLETKVKPLPRNSQVIIRPRSALGLKYVEILQGPRRDADGRPTPGFSAGATIPLSAATPPRAPETVEIDEVFNTFDRPTRRAAQANLEEFGNAFTGRGQALNETIENLNPLFASLLPVMRNLADPSTGLNRFFVNIGRTAAIVAPVAEEQAQLFANLDTTFSALAEVARPFIQDSISGGPAALDAAIRSFPIQRPFLANTEGLFRELRPGVRAFRTGAPPLADALRVGTPTLRRVTALNSRLIPTFQALRRFATDPQVPLGIRKLTETVSLVAPIAADLAPAQTVCNYLSLWFRNVSSLLSDGDVNGTWQRFTILATPTGPNNEGGPSSRPASGPNQDNYLHSNPYPHAAGPGQPRECEAGNEPFPVGQVVTTNPPGSQSARTDTSP
jgi:ABC-type transporter Mla subunit MlaD